LASQQSFLENNCLDSSTVALGVKSDWYHNIGTATAGWTVLIYSHLFLITGFISQLLQTIDLCRKLVLLHNMALTNKLIDWCNIDQLMPKGVMRRAVENNNWTAALSEQSTIVAQVPVLRLTPLLLKITSVCKLWSKYWMCGWHCFELVHFGLSPPQGSLLFPKIEFLIKGDIWGWSFL